ncbi:MAG: CCA tRNA nucleotidyltransferase [Maricaulis sp.]|nr:CCA tRNA nucleotidyltransferase [Maricaulis sp.]
MNPLSLDPREHDWMRAKGTLSVMAALDAAQAGQSRFVGGCVRSALLGEPVADIDIATQLRPADVMAAAEDAGLRVIPTGIEHGTVTIIADGVEHEVTSLRQDVETDGRRAVVSFTDDWTADAQRRDFRLNALYADLNGEIFDPTGGLADVAKRRFVFVGSAEQRIREDYLRTLRLFRFEAWYGHGDLDAVGLAAAVDLQAGLKKLSIERVWSELKKILAAPDPRAVLRVMSDTGILKNLIDVNGSLRILGGIVVQDIITRQRPDSLLRFVALAGVGQKRIRDMAAKMKMSKAEAKRLDGAVDPSVTEDVLGAFSDMAAAERAIMALGARAFEDQARLAAAGEIAPPPRDWTLLAKFAQEWKEPDFPIKGGDLILRGYEPGPMLGDAMDELKAFWIAERFEPTKQALLDRLKQ